MTVTLRTPNANKATLRRALLITSAEDDSASTGFSRFSRYGAVDHSAGPCRFWRPGFNTRVRRGS